jgi:parallel beta-helix repeat protein
MNRAIFASLTILCLLSVSEITGFIQVAKADCGTIYIRADGSIDPPTAPMHTADNITYTLTGNITVDADGIVIERDNIVVDGAGYTINRSMESRNGSGIMLTSRSNVTVRDMTIKNFFYAYGIRLHSSSNNTLSGNNVTASSWVDIATGGGISLQSSSDNNVLSGNNVANNVAGILLDSSSNNTLSDNNAANNGGKDGRGIALCSSSRNTLSGNNVANNTYGIVLEYSSDNNTLSANNVTANNEDGIRVRNSSGNRIFHNNFLNNTYQTYVEGSINTWDDGYPSGGNYWSDYNGTDANHDGIGDTLYVVDANNADHYPLVVPNVIPEFPSFLILPLFMVATLLAVTIYKKSMKTRTGTREK